MQSVVAIFAETISSRHEYTMRYTCAQLLILEIRHACYRKVNRETRFRAALSRILNAFLTQIYSVRVSGLLDLAATYVIIHIARLAR